MLCGAQLKLFIRAWATSFKNLLVFDPKQELCQPRQRWSRSLSMETKRESQAVALVLARRGAVLVIFLL